jgi:hypothetical protein
MARSVRVPVPALAALAVVIIAGVLAAVSDSWPSGGNAYSIGGDIGLVARYACLAALGAWLIQRILAVVARARIGAARPAAAAPLAAGLAVVLAVAIVPLFLSDPKTPLAPSSSSPASSAEADLRAGFMSGCTRANPQTYCECVLEIVQRDPRADSLSEWTAIARRMQQTGQPQEPFLSAARTCAERG